MSILIPYALVLCLPQVRKQVSDDAISHIRMISELSASQLRNDLGDQSIVSKPANDPVRWLIQRGTKALSALCSFVRSLAPTKLRIEPAIGFHAVFISRLFDERPKTLSPVSAGTWSQNLEWKLLKKPYQVTVGDVCFFILGRIVNRNYLPYWVVPGRATFVGSPSLVPSLGKEAVKEWQSKTEQDPRRSLLADAALPDRQGRDIGALECLKRYFPSEVTDAACLRLADKLRLDANFEKYGPEGNLQEIAGIDDTDARLVLEEVTGSPSPRLDSICSQYVKALSDAQIPAYGYSSDLLMLTCLKRLGTEQSLIESAERYLANRGRFADPELRQFLETRRALPVVDVAYMKRPNSHVGRALSAAHIPWQIEGELRLETVRVPKDKLGAAERILHRDAKAHGYWIQLRTSHGNYAIVDTARRH